MLRIAKTILWFILLWFSFNEVLELLKEAIVGVLEHYLLVVVLKYDKRVLNLFNEVIVLGFL